MSNNNTTVPVAATAGVLFSKGFPHFLISDIFMYLVSSGVVIVNASILVMFLVQRCRKPSKTRINPSGALVLNLLVSDALVGLMGIFITASFATSGFTSTVYGCINRVTVRYFFRMGSHMALINVCVDRYIAIMHTLHYREYVTIERCLGLIGFGWFVPTCVVAYAYLANDWQPGLVFCYQFPSFTIFLNYIRLPSHIAALFCVVFIQCRILFHLKNHEKNSPQYLRQYSRKSARVLFWVTTTYVLCWLPFDVILVLILFVHNRAIKIILDGAVPLAHISFMVNAFIFSYKTENIRKPVSDFCADMLVALRRKTEAVSDPSQTSAQQKEIVNDKRPSSIYSKSSNTGTGTGTTNSTATHGGLSRDNSAVALHM